MKELDLEANCRFTLALFCDNDEFPLYAIRTDKGFFWSDSIAFNEGGSDYECFDL